MDPITLVALAVLALAGTGAGAAGVAHQRRKARREAMRAAVVSVVPCGGDPPVSLCDVFWDLGASEFALEMLAHRGLLLEHPDDLASLVATLPAQVAESGGYRAFIEEHLAAIEQMYRDHRSAGDRRAIVGLTAPARRALPAGGGGPLVTGHDAIDVDEAVDTDVGRLLGSLFDGSIAQQAKRWFALREARKLRDELDRELAELHRIYALNVRSDPDALAHLHDAGRRWEAEATRIAAGDLQGRFKAKPWALCGRVLVDEARRRAEAMAAHAHANVDNTLGLIDGHALGGNVAMAGYLVYLNRFAFFVGRAALCEPAVRAIEAVLGRLQAELTDVRRRGLL